MKCNEYSARDNSSDVPTQGFSLKYLTLVRTPNARHLVGLPSRLRIQKILFHTILRPVQVRSWHRRFGLH